MRRTAIALGLVAVLLVSLYGLALAQTPVSQYDRTATFEIGEIIDISISDSGSQGLAFGSQLPGSLTPEAAQNVSTPAVRLTVNSSTNVTCNIVISATTFSAPGASTT